MSTVTTVLGPIDSSQLGFTLPHEHLIDSSAGVRASYPELEFRDRASDMSMTDFTAAKAGGVDTVIEVSPMDLGRDVELMRDVSRETGVNFVCATGCWLDIPRSFWGRTPDFIADLWVREIEQGIDGTDIRAGIIKVATSDPITEHEELMLRASARTHLRTGVPITTHTQAQSRVGERQVAILKEEGVQPQNIYVGHINQTLDPDYHRELARLGVWLGWDINNPFGRSFLPPWEQRVDYFKSLLDEGLGSNLMMSHDWNVVLSRISTMGSPGRDANPDGYLWLSRAFIPRLQKLGVPESTIDQVMIKNPQKYFDSQRPKS